MPQSYCLYGENYGRSLKECLLQANYSLGEKFFWGLKLLYMSYMLVCMYFGSYVWLRLLDVDGVYT